jgi:hypothetical protein
LRLLILLPSRLAIAGVAVQRTQKAVGTKE